MEDFFIIVTIMTTIIAVLSAWLLKNKSKELYAVEQERDYYLSATSFAKVHLEELPKDTMVADAKIALFSIMKTYKKDDSSK